MRTPAKALQVAVLAMAGAALLLLAVTANGVQVNAARPRLCAGVTAITGRRCDIDGDLTLYWRAGGAGVPRWLPQPYLRLRALRFGNPDWAASGPTMAAVARADVRIALLPLFRGEFELTPTELVEPRLVLERGPEAQVNWQLRKRPNVRWNLRELDIGSGTVRYADPPARTDVTVRLARRRGQDGVEWTLDGHLGKEEVSGYGLLGKTPALDQLAASYPFEAAVAVGKTRLKADGEVADPFGEPRLDLRLSVTGASLAQLYPFTGLALPETPRFSLDGRLNGALARNDFHLRLEKFSGTVGGSDIAGTLDYRRQQPRPLLSGEIASARLDWKDLAPLIGTEAPPVRQARGAATRHRPDKMFPVEPFRLGRWTHIDARVRLRVERFVRAGHASLNASSASISLKDGMLSLAPLRIGLAGGRIDAELSIDGNAAPPAARLALTARQLKLRQLFPGVAAIQGSRSELSGTARLSASGDSIASLLATASGEARAVAGQGSLSRQALDAIGLNLGGLLFATLFGDSRVRLDCAVADFGVENGIMRSRAFVIDTEDAIIQVDGNIDLRQEALALEVRPESKGISLMSLRAPLHVRGSFRHPAVEADKRIVALRTGAAAALGLVASPLAALLPLMSTGSDHDSPCAGRLAAVRRNPPSSPETVR